MTGWKRTAVAILLAGCASEGTGARGHSVPGEPGVLEGTVVDDLGTAVPKAVVGILGPPHDGVFGDFYPALGQTETSDEGRFSLVGIPPGPCFVVVEAPEHAPVHLLPVVAPARGVEPVCPRWGRVRFRLVPPPGEAPPDRADLCIATCPRYQPDSRSEGRGGGVFERGDFAPGLQELVIVSPGWTPVSTTFTAEPGRIVDIGEITLERGHAVQGRVVDERGAPLAGARVHANDYWTSDFSTTTDAAGGFRIGHLPAGEVHFGAQAAGYGSRGFPVQVPAEGGETRIVLHRGGVLHVRIRTKNGGMPYSCAIRVVALDAQDPVGEGIYGQVSCGGVFDLSLRAGRYRVEDLGPWIDRAAASREVALEVAGERTVEFVEDGE